MEDLVYPHVIVDGMGNRISLERYLTGFKCRMCSADADLGVLYASETSYTLQCPSCGDTSHHRAVEVNLELQLIERKAAEREEALLAARKDDEAILAAATLKSLQKGVKTKKSHARGTNRRAGTGGTKRGRSKTKSR